MSVRALCVKSAGTFAREDFVSVIVVEMTLRSGWKSKG